MATKWQVSWPNCDLNQLLSGISLGLAKHRLQEALGLLKWTQACTGPSASEAVSC
jgi:hypothetical protein